MNDLFLLPAKHKIIGTRTGSIFVTNEVITGNQGATLKIRLLF